MLSDRYVLMGNHRDAWVFGSVDPSSGTASMMEISRAFAQQLKNGLMCICYSELDLLTNYLDANNLYSLPKV